MTPYKAQEKLREAYKSITSVKSSTGNPCIRGSCNIILRPLQQLIDNIIFVDFDKEDEHVLDL